MNIIPRVVLAGMLLASTGLASAQDSTTKWSVFASAGRADSGGGIKEATQNHPNGCESGGLLCLVDDEDTAFQIGIGRVINKHFAVNFAYTDFGKTYDLFAPSSQESLVQETEVLSATVIGQYPLGNSFYPYAELGVGYYKSSIEYTRPGNRLTGSDDGLTKILGLGIRYQPNRNWGVQLGWQRFYDLGESSGSLTATEADTISLDVDYVYLGLSYSF